METQQTETAGISLVQVQDELNNICMDNLRPIEATFTLMENFYNNFDSTSLLPKDRIRPLGELCYKNAEELRITIQHIEKISEKISKINNQLKS